jgi:predicted nucleic-acid-binding Zn-ribbon protein
MSNDKYICPKCGGEMKAGFLIDLINKNPVMEIAEQMEWVEGDSSQRSALTGGVKLSGKDRRKVTTYCCNGCGYLESYAVK